MEVEVIDHSNDHFNGDRPACEELTISSGGSSRRARHILMIVITGIYLVVSRFLFLLLLGITYLHWRSKYWFDAWAWMDSQIEKRRTL